MAERFRLVVQPSDAHPDIFPVKDAMRQVFDMFEYLATDESKDVVWTLISASTNSPLTIEAEAVSYDPQVDVTVAARAQKARAVKEVSAALTGDAYALRSVAPDRLRVLERIFKRNVDGIGRTSFHVDHESLIDIDVDHAKSAIEAIATQQEQLSRAHVAVGSIEGLLESVGTYYHRPVLMVLDRRTNEHVRCLVTPETRDAIAEGVNLIDVWSGQRVMVRGKIRYDAEGKITQVEANRIDRVSPRSDLTAEALYDADFTGGLPSEDYVERLREGELG